MTSKTRPPPQKPWRLHQRRSTVATCEVNKCVVCKLFELGVSVKSVKPRDSKMSTIETRGAEAAAT